MSDKEAQDEIRLVAMRRTGEDERKRDMARFGYSSDFKPVGGKIHAAYESGITEEEAGTLMRSARFGTRDAVNAVNKLGAAFKEQDHA